MQMADDRLIGVRMHLVYTRINHRCKKTFFTFLKFFLERFLHLRYKCAVLLQSASNGLVNCHNVVQSVFTTSGLTTICSKTRYAN